ncbi:TIM barrel protein [Nanoarchaeota archaeon]
MTKFKPKELYFGTPGIPIRTEPRETVNGVREVKKLGLGAMELEFVRMININKDKAPIVKETASKEGIVMTSHGQYFVNLASLKKETIHASVGRMVDAAVRASECGAYSITWHAAFYQGREKELIYKMVKDGFKEVLKKVHDKGIKDIWLRPETMGKPTQWGDLKEVLKLSSEVEGVLPCIDWSHLHARTIGKNNTLKEFKEMLGEYEKVLGREGLNNMHCHLSGINYGEKGEKNHLVLKESDMNYKD